MIASQTRCIFCTSIKEKCCPFSLARQIVLCSSSCCAIAFGVPRRRNETTIQKAKRTAGIKERVTYECHVNKVFTARAARRIKITVDRSALHQLLERHVDFSFRAPVTYTCPCIRRRVHLCIVTFYLRAIARPGRRHVTRTIDRIMVVHTWQIRKRSFKRRIVVPVLAIIIALCAKRPRVWCSSRLPTIHGRILPRTRRARVHEMFIVIHVSSGWHCRPF